MLYRIYTEDVNRDKTIALTSKVFPGFTVYTGTGYWQGKPEANLTLEIATSDHAGILALARDIRTANRQQAVLVQSLTGKSTLVEV